MGLIYDLFTYLVVQTQCAHAASPHMISECGLLHYFFGLQC